MEMKTVSRERIVPSSPLSPVLKSFMSGAVSGSCSALLFQPLDLLKTRLQVNCWTTAHTHSACRRPGMMQVASNIITEESAVGLWKGVLPSLTRVVPGVGLYFCCLHTMRSWLDRPTSALQSLLLGASARLLAGAATIPFTVVKTRWESGRFQYSGVTEALSTVYRTEGGLGLTRGLVPTLMRDVPFSAVYYMIYSQSRGTVSGGSDISVFCCGLHAGVLASLVTQPADVLKTRVQMYSCTGADVPRYLYLRHAAISVYQEDGVRGFFSGLAPRVIRRSCMAAMAWTLYERVSRAL